MPRSWSLATVVILALSASRAASAGGPDFPAEEFVARRVKVAEAIGNGAVAVLQGAAPACGLPADGRYQSRDKEEWTTSDLDKPVLIVSA
jgi:hypothetical protein